MMKKHLFLLCSFLLLYFGASGTLLAAKDTYNVLFIQSYTNHTPWHQKLSEGLRDGLEKGGVKANIITEYLNADYWSFPSECVIMRRICERARQRNTDLIVTSGDEAFYTLARCGDSLAYQLPVVVSGIKYPDKKLMDNMPNVCGYLAESDLLALLQEAHRVFPKRTEVICLSDSSFLGRTAVAQLEELWPSFQKQHPEYTLKKLNIQTESPNGIVASICYDYNAFNRVVVVPRWTPFLSFIGKNSKAPFFACQNLALTNGVFCVHDVEPAQGTYAAGRSAAQILKGALPVTYGVMTKKGTLIYDYKQLDFFHVSQGMVEDQGVIMNIPLIDRYRIWFILFYSVIVVSLVLLVIWLFRVNRRESRRRIHAQTRLLVQHRLVEQRDEFDNIFCSIRDGLITYDTDLRIHFVNRSLMLMLGLSPEANMARHYEGQIAGSIFGIYVSGENILHDLLKQVLREKKPISIPEKTFMQENAKGIYFPISGEVVPVFAKDRLTGMAIVCRNISDEEMQQRFFDMAIEESSIYPWQYNMRMNSFNFPDGLLQRFNKFDNTNFVSRAELDGVIHPDDLEITHKHFDSILQGHELNSRMNFRVLNTEGHYEWWEFRCTAYDGLTLDIPYMVLGVCQSIQRYKDTEEELIAARDRALQTDKLKSAFLANMSHEIRTPLNSIVGFSDLLKDIEMFSSEEVKQFVETINTNCTLLLALISDILDLSRIESGTMDFQLSSQNLTYVMHEVHDSQRLSMPEGVELLVDIPEGEDKHIITDTVRLKQVVNNFINNAKKFTIKGSITFGYVVKEPGYTTIFVEDTGAGISDEDQKRIFERFYKVDSFTQGAGLGLSICQMIVERLHGDISVTSQMGKGTRFEVRVPDTNE